MNQPQYRQQTFAESQAMVPKRYRLNQADFLQPGEVPVTSTTSLPPEREDTLPQRFMRAGKDLAHIVLRKMTPSRAAAQPSQNLARPYPQRPAYTAAPPTHTGTSYATAPKPDYYQHQPAPIPVGAAPGSPYEPHPFSGYNYRSVSAADLANAPAWGSWTVPSPDQADPATFPFHNRST